MGEVWEAWDAELQRAVAVKLLTAVPGDPGAGSRLRDEARAVARLSDPNIAAVHDVYRAPDGRDYLVMELVRGSSVQQLIREHGPLSWPTVADLGAQTARALAAAHRASVVHHDIKPSNLLVTDEQVVKVVDFGIAATPDAGTAPDAGGAPGLGTAAYTAPERALGHPSGAAADLYALGCVLYEALTGHPPFVGGDPAEVLYRHIHEEPAPVAPVRPDAPAELGALVHRLLAKSPQDRPRSAAETAHALAAWAGPGSAAVAVPGASATQLLPPVPASAPAEAAPPDDGATALLPQLLSDDEPPHSARSGDPRGRRRGLLLVGGLVGAALAVVLVIVLLAAVDTGGNQAGPASESTAGGSASAAPGGAEATASATGPGAPVPATTTPGTPSTAPPSTVASTAPPSTAGPAQLAADLNAAYPAASASMQQKLARETRGDVNEIAQKLRGGETGKAAEKARDLRQSLVEAQTKGKWDGDAVFLRLLQRIAAG